MMEPIDWTVHTMGPNLLPYLEMKVHNLAQRLEWRRITVIGQYDRGCLVSTLEKQEKSFNWQRPTAEISGRELIIKCFPGRDYVHHYALMIATYLALKDRFRSQVYFELPDASTCNTEVARVCIDVSEDDVVILGWGIEQLAGSQDWALANGYRWKRTKSGDIGLVYIGFLHSIWGDVAGRVVARLAACGARRIIYVGKVGTLDPGLAPNTVLATGNRSLLGARQIDWKDFFDGQAAHDPAVVSGIHVTSPSTLLETQEWLEKHNGYSFVDPEIGQMGSAASQAGLTFGYLHVVSNNLARRYEEDLSNERLPAVRQRRAQLLDKVKAIIEQRLHEVVG